MNIVRALACGLASLSLAGCYVLGNDEGERYLQRKDTVTLNAGDAKEVNARTHMLAAWPPGVGNRRIPMEGSRGVRAAECYRIAAKSLSTGSTGSGAGGGGIQVNVNNNNAPGSGQGQDQGKPAC